MNDDTDKPLNPVGDAALEARITAWVLGEASPFEAAELEEICNRDPEARLFERRLRVLHGFVTADRKAGPDEAWKLPAEKRAKIEALFDDEPVVEKEEVIELPKIVNRGQTGRRALLALAACTVISAAGWALFSSVGVSSKEALAMKSKVEVSPMNGEREARNRLVELRGIIVDRAENNFAYDAPASPAVRGPLPAEEPAAQIDSLAAVEAKGERGQVMEESLARLEEKPALSRSKSSVEVPSQAQARRYLDLEKSSPMATMKPAAVADSGPAPEVAAGDVPAPTTAPTATAATGAIALNDFSDHQMLGKELGAARSGKPADLEADAVTRFGRAADASAPEGASSLNTRSRSETPLFDSKASIGGVLRFGEAELAQPSTESGRVAGGPPASNSVGGWSSWGGVRGDANAPARPASGAAEDHFFAHGATQQATGDTFGMAADGIVGGLKSDLSLEYNSAVTNAPTGSGGGAILGIPADPSVGVNKIMTAGQRSGQGEINRNSIDAILSNTDRPEAEVAGDLKKDVTLMMNGSVSNFTVDPEADTAGAKVQAQTALGANAADRDAAWFMKQEATKQLPELQLAEGKKSADGPYSGLAQKEMIRRQSAVATSDALRDEGRDAYAKGDYKAAVDKYKASLDVLPDAEMVKDRRDYLNQVLSDGSTALGESYRKVGKYEEARQLAGDTLARDPNNVQAKALQDYLDDPIRTNPALTYGDDKNTDEVRRKLYMAEGNYNLGKFDDASKAYEDVLRTDPYNKAARRGMESVASAKANYYRAAYDQTRAELLAQVDRAWETAVPPEEGSKGLKDLAKAKDDVSASMSEVSDEEVILKLDKAIHEGEEKLQQDPNSTEIQAQLQQLGRVRDGFRSEIETKAKSEKKQEQNKAPEPVALAETATAAEPFSTFSLHVSDASFKMAKAALDRGEVPAADGIRPEEFYNAFDYGDAAPANGEPVVCAVEQCAHPALPQRNLLRIGVRTGSQGRGGSTPLNLTLLLDSSGSMEREDRNAGLVNAVQQLSGLLKEGDTVSVIGFARQPRLLVDRLPGNRAQELNAILARTPSEGGTNLEEGLKLGEELALRQFNPAAQNRIVLFTDGAANLGDAKPETLQAKVELMRQHGIAFDAAGFGTEGLNDKLLERLTRNGNGRYYIVDRAEDADAGFAKQLAGAFRPAAENVKVQVRFNPARVAKYKLIGFEEHRLKKEDFRNDSVDAAEMAAEEAGNALYQIETLPQGEGEVGEVSVRFRDAASGQMVERTWTIPYEAQAPAFDQATPSIELAGLAAFAAEKLRAAPMAEAVDFQQLAPVMAKVKARYANSKPVAELESMIGKLK
ncbi:YfbK domain-containing protein [Luteolibacter soli]|uniref:von Willebrand factor type A domain-containing protein n=1 Tax=Luteolibacter soli TaxID=3135280 RepID=A0ABU9B3A6_9BACT